MSSVKTFVDIALTILIVHLIHFQEVHFVLFQVTFLSKFCSLSSKSAFFTKLAISLLLAKFSCANLAQTFSDVNLLIP